MADRFAQIGAGGDLIVYDPLLYGAVTRSPLSLYGLEGIERTRAPLDLEALGRLPFGARLNAMMALAAPYLLPLFPSTGAIFGRMAVGLPARLRDLLTLGAAVGGVGARATTE